MRALALVCTIVLSSVPAQATSTIAIRTPTFIALGADSKVVTADGENRGSLCKINITGQISWAASGVFSHDRTNFVLMDVISAAMENDSPIEDRIRTAENFVATDLKRAVESVNSVSPGYVYTHLNKPWIGIAFAYVKQRTLLLKIRTFFVRQGFSGYSVDVDASDLPSSAFPDIALVAMGRNEAINRQMSGVNIGQWIGNRGANAAIRELIEMEIADKPDEVGRPIAIANIDGSGSRWISPCSAN